MKRFLCLLILLSMVLAGCQVEPPVQTEGTTAPVETTVPEDLPGLYQPDSQMEELTEGAVRAYPLGNGDCSGIKMMGGKILLFEITDNGTDLTVLAGDTLWEESKISVNCSIFPSTAQVSVNEKGVCYYNELTQEAVLLNTKLEEQKRVKVPGVNGEQVAIARDWSEVYYCTENEIRGLNLSTEIPRLIRVEENALWQTLQGIYYNDQVLHHFVEVSESAYRSNYISAETGEIISDFTGIDGLQTVGTAYYAQITTGALTESVYGSDDKAARVLTPAQENAMIIPVLEMNGAVSVATDETGSWLDFYNLGTSERAASVFLPEVFGVLDVLADIRNNHLWIRAYDPETTWQTLYSWDLTASEVMDATDYSILYATAGNKDAKGLAECGVLADQIGEKYGVEIRIGAEAMEPVYEGYTFEEEYKVLAIEKALNDIDRCLARYPNNFLSKLGEDTGAGVLQIGILRAIYGDAAKGTVARADGVQYWNGNDAYYSVVANWNTEQNLYHEIFHGIDTYVLSRCSAYDDWEDLNPEGFSYDYDYVLNESRDGSQYLQDGQEAFIDTYSMSFPKEDRARIMEYAMMPQMESYFESEIMQSKLRQLCLGIREAFELERIVDVLPWEVYLNESIAPTVEHEV